VKLYYPAHAEGPELAIAQVKQLANLPAGIQPLEKLAAQLKPPRPDVSFALAEALYGTGQRERAIAFYAMRESGNPQLAVREWAGNGDAGANLLERAMKLAPDEPDCCTGSDPPMVR